MVFDAAADVRLYGKHAAQIIRNCVRDVALADHDTKLATFRIAARTLSDVALDQWLPKNVIADRLYDIALANDMFGRSADEIQTIIADETKALRAPKSGLTTT